MPHAVTHVLIAIILLDIIRDHVLKKKHRMKFPLHYLLIVGIAGLLPDIDIVIYWIVNIISNVPLSEVHRTFTHTIFFPIIFVVAGLVTWKVKSKFLARHKMRLNTVFFIIALGTFIHLVLDATLSGVIMPIYPLNTMALGLNLVQLTPWPDTILPAIDAILLLGWLAHEEVKHKISDFI
jgi:membrane-bound metal-dependent hydrolase YbcI (DUF457 family)